MCVYCDTSNSLSSSGYSIISKKGFNLRIVNNQNSEYYIVVSIYEELKNINGQYDNSPSKGYSQRIYYCPMCAKEL